MRLYRLLTGPDDSSFCHKVTRVLNAGWELYGGPTQTFDATTGHVVCGQAVVKEVDGLAYDPSMKLGDY